MLTKILAKTNDEKGKLFEELMGDILDSQGYTNLIFNWLAPQGEFDITGRHRFSGQDILVECKAEARPIGKQKLLKFHSKYTVEYDNRAANEKLPLLGLFFSLSGFTEPAFRYYEAMSEKTRKRFRIFGHDEITDILKVLKLTFSEETIKQIADKSLPYNIGKCYLTKSSSGLHWVILFLTDGKMNHYVVLDSKGDIAIRRVYEELEELDEELYAKNMINLQARRKVILCLSDCITKTREAIAEASGESKIDVSMELDRLVKENICRATRQNNTKLYTLVKDIIPFAQLTREFLETMDGNNVDGNNFAKSDYYFAMIDDRLVNHVQDRFRIQLPDKRKESLRRLLLCSPSALLYCLFDNTDFFDRSWNERQKFDLSDPVYVPFTELRISHLMMELSFALLKDIKDSKFIDLRSKIGIRAAAIIIEIKLATICEKYLHEKSGYNLCIGQKQGDISAGKLVSLSEPIGFLDLGSAFYHIGEFEQAIGFYDNGLKQTQNSDVKAKLLNNKGMAFCSLGQHKEAIEYYNEAIKLDTENLLALPRLYKGKCLSHLGQYKEAINCGKDALKIDPSCEFVKDFLVETKAKLQKLSESDMEL